ncbi:MAG: tetracycline 7-halogenase / O2-dependent halogenase [Blastocatellia bacterium]|jgi:FADH2 O2-dependent halogenase|nr:tetracycline 7-halogenase / O2-dependent halogenase [Blastocatellia bacterium]
MENKEEYDVIILGTGIGGTMLGAILSRNKLKVLMLDSETHPRFAIGEATTPDTNFRLKLLALKYGLPEISFLSAFQPLRDYVSPACGVKRAFSFLYQREGKDQIPTETHQYPTLAPPMGPDCHFFRQDTDAFMMAVAVDYGAKVRQKTRIAEIDIQEDRVTLTSEKGETFRGKYLVDGTGMKSVLSHKFQLRDDPDKFRTNTRAIFTHMVGVKLYDQVGASRQKHGLKYPLSQSTLHHVFEGGWFWVIPFNNHQDSTNPLCSVGLVLNRRIHPETGMDAEEEFWSYVNKFPDMVRQFEGAQAIRDWVSTGRLQYGAKSISGHRYCLLSHAGFFIDPLYSTGLALTTAWVDLLGGQLLKAFSSGDFAVESFDHLNVFFSNNIGYADEMVSSSFVAFRDFDLWDAWFRVWVLALFIGTALNASLYLRYRQTKDKRVLDQTGKEPYSVLLGGKFPEFQKLYRQALAEMDRVRDGQTSPAEAAKQIRGLFKGIEYLPTYWHWHQASVRTTPAFTIWGMTRMYIWFLLFAPRATRKLLFGWRPLTAYNYVLSSILDNNRASKRRKRSYIRDVFKAWNLDWLSAKSAESNGHRQGPDMLAAKAPHREMNETPVSVSATLP